MRQQTSRNAFTLIEVLVVLIILSILSAMVTTAVSGVRTTAREARTKRIISIVDSVIAEQYEQLRYRPLPVEIPYIRFFASPTGKDLAEGEEITVGYEVLADESARVRLLMLRDLQRIELPDRYSDITAAPTVIPAAASPVIERKKDGLQQIVSVAETVEKDIKRAKAKRRSFQAAWYTTIPDPENPTELFAGDIPPKLLAYRSRQSTRRTEENQGAECLYLILATSFVGGQPAIAAIPNSNIGDTDDDGMPEILDGWGRPLQFIRWPVGYTPSAPPSEDFEPLPNADFELTVDVNKPDDFDLFHADYAYVAKRGPAWVTDRKNGNATLRPWAMKPLIFSLGEDGESGIAVNPGDQPSFANLAFSYSHPDWKWPIDEDHFGIEVGGRSSDDGMFPFLDPYLRRFIELNSEGALPGELLGASLAEWNRSAAQATDNITNYQLQVAP